MELQLQGEYELFIKGMEALQDDYGFTIHPHAAIILDCKKSEKQELIVQYKNQKATITYQKAHHFFRGLGLLLEQIKMGNEIFTMTEHPQFQTIGPMFDFSRNAVMNETYFKKMINTLAIMGFNTAMLYMEDTYEVKTEPYFGYMRGRYSQVELKKMDDYAHQFGIELIPCIQTLAHLEEFLKWSNVHQYKDTRGALLLESEPTYALLKEMIQTVSSSFRSKRLHIGMDEAEELGRGIFLNQNGYKPRFDLMKVHLERVLQITKDLELDVMMWSDMFLKLASKTGDHYSKTTEIPKYIIDQTPKDVQMMYWQYNATEVEHYEKMLKQQKSFHKKPAFAGGIWIWNTFGTNYHLSLQASEAALKACKNEDIDDVFITLWGDDGQETTPFHALLGLQYYAEHAYHKEVTNDMWKSRTNFCTGIDAEAYVHLSSLDRPPGVAETSIDQTNPSKFLLWQDVLLGVFDKHIDGLEVGEFYQQLSYRIHDIRTPKANLDFIFEVPQKLCEVLAIKAEIGIKLKDSYDQTDVESLQQLATIDLPEIIVRVKELRHAHRNQWLTINKPFGFEVIDIRYGGVVNRIETAIMRITDYLEGNVEHIEELEVERLYYDPNTEDSNSLGWCSYYYRMASPNVFFHVLPIY